MVSGLSSSRFSIGIFSQSGVEAQYYLRLRLDQFLTCLVAVGPPAPVAGFAGGLVVEELLLPAPDTAPAALPPVLVMLDTKYFQ